MNKRIEEMAKHCPFYEEGNCLLLEEDALECDMKCDMCTFMNTLYNAGYRKQIVGEWKKRGNEKTCSLCKFIYYSNNDDWNFCPNCGARMSGGKK